MQVPETVLKTLNLETEEDITNFLLSSLQWTEFAEKYFRNPDDIDEPLKLEPGQKKAINAIQFGYDIEAVPSNYVIKNPPKIVVMIWSRQCIANDTLIQLSNGLVKNVEEIRDYDPMVCYSNYRFKNTKATRKTVESIEPCLKIITKYGRELKCTYNHPLLTSLSSLIKPSYIRARHLKIGDKIAMIRHLPEMGKEILSDDEIKFIGYMIGDGCLSGHTPFFTNKDHDIVLEWKKIVGDWHQYRNKGKLRCMYSCKNKKLKQLIEDLGLKGTKSGNKFVPQIIFESSTRQVAIFLSKLIDTDGCVSMSNDRKSCQVRYVSKSKRLIKELSLLFTRIGMYGNIYTEKQGDTNYYRIQFNGSQSITNAKKYLSLCPKKQKILDRSIIKGLSTSDVYPFLWKVLKIKKKHGITEEDLIKKGFYINRKNKGITISKINLLEKILPEFKVDKNIYWDEIVSIEDIGKQQITGLAVFPYHNHITNGFITENTGKTTGVYTCADTILVLQEGVKIGVMAQSETMAKEFIQRAADMLRNSPFKNDIEKVTKMEIRMKHGGYMRAHTTSESIRGQSYHYLILDEAARIESEIIEGAALDTARKIGKRVIMLSTPAGYGGALVKYYSQGLKRRPIICKNCFTKFTQAHFETTQYDPITMARGLPPCPECGFHLEDGNSEKEDIMTNEKIIEGKTYFYGVKDYTVISIDPFSSSFYSKEDILQELRRRGNTALARQELLGEIIAEGQGVFRKEWLDHAEDPALQNIFKKKKEFNYIMGVDFGKVHDNSVAVVGHEDPKSKQIIVDFVKIIRSGDNIEYEDIKNDLIEIVAYFKPIWILADATGLGEPVIEFMERDLIRIGWQGRIFSNKTNHLGFYIDPKTKPDLIENLVTYFARKRIRMPARYDGDVSVLYNELLNFAYDITKANYLKYGVQTEHDDCVISLALMVYGHRHKPWIPLDAAFALPRGGLL